MAAIEYFRIWRASGAQNSSECPEINISLHISSTGDVVWQCKELGWIEFKCFLSVWCGFMNGFYISISRWGALTYAEGSGIGVKTVFTWDSSELESTLIHNGCIITCSRLVFTSDQMMLLALWKDPRQMSYRTFLLILSRCKRPTFSSRTILSSVDGFVRWAGLGLTVTVKLNIAIKLVARLDLQMPPRSVSVLSSFSTTTPSVTALEKSSGWSSWFRKTDCGSRAMESWCLSF